MMKKLLIPLCLLSFSISATQAEVNAGDILTGDTKLACEAILCLSSSVGGNVSECTPSIKKYFSISAKKMKDTIKKRKNFLKLCPTSNEPGMPELVELLSQNTRRCTAEILNIELLEKRYRYKDDYAELYYRISNKLPNDCRALNNSQYTDYNLHYVGVSEWQSDREFRQSPKGKWVD